MKIVTVVGVRPQFIKAAMVSKAIRSTPGLEEVLVNTGQHYDGNMSKVFFSQLRIPYPRHDLGIGSATHGKQTGRMLEAIERVLIGEKPFSVVVYGDTNSTLAGALAATKLHILVAHVEAGLRSFDRCMPEEINRILTDHVSDLLFAPTRTAATNLFREGIPTRGIHVVGDVMYDAAIHYGERAEAESLVLDRLRLQRGKYVLATIHRAENTDNPDHLKVILAALAMVAKELPVVLPLHPRTRAAAERYGLLRAAAHSLLLTRPASYLDMVMLERGAGVIATDSGGVQREAFFHRVPCVTLRNHSEWVELLELKWNRLVPPSDPHLVAEAILRSLGVKGEADAALFGRGDAASRIVGILKGVGECGS